MQFVILMGKLRQAGSQLGFSGGRMPALDCSGASIPQPRCVTLIYLAASCCLLGF